MIDLKVEGDMKENDQYLILKIEFPGIKDIISKYSSKGLIGNYLNTMEQALATNASSEVLYCLDSICAWYKDNIAMINSNEWTFNKFEHAKAKAMLEEQKKRKSPQTSSGRDKMSFLNTAFLSAVSAEKMYVLLLKAMLKG